MSKYLYGASVQGIQDFIFKTNKLKEIIGASEIIKDIDKIKFKEKYSLKQEPRIILQAAGNIRIVFKNKTDLDIVVKNLPKDIMLNAYGITISQAVVKLNNYKVDSKELEKKLKIQRNKVTFPLDFHFNILKQNSKTAKPSVKKIKIINKKDEYEYLDKATLQKTKACPKDEENKELKDISNNNNKIAIIHADGNGLGNIVKTLDENQIVEFSKKLETATNEAYEIASKDIAKIRKVILGGDDLTIICNANDALIFTKKFLDAFEEKTKNIHDNKSLTACAGITYCNEKYPFHYAVKLAEELCSFAKKDSKAINKDLPPSSLIFHNIKSSNVESFSKFIEDELTIKDVRLDFGPYYLKEQDKKVSIESLNKILIDFRKENAPRGRLREWLSDLEFDSTYAQNQLERINEITKWDSSMLQNLYEGLKIDNLIVQKEGLEKTPIYDILQILSVEDEKEDEK